VLTGVVPWVLADDESLRDPTRPLGYYGNGKVAAQKLQLNSILISADRKLAIINGQTLRENDVIKGSADIRIARIEANNVLLIQGDKRWQLSLNAALIRQ
jgi:MSHA biogenesis protein MshK